MRTKRGYRPEGPTGLEGRAAPAGVVPVTIAPPAVHAAPVAVAPPAVVSTAAAVVIPGVVPTKPLPHLSIGAYNQAVTDIQETFYVFAQSTNLVLGNYGPTAPVDQGLKHAVRAIPYHHRSGLDAAMRAVVWKLRAALLNNSQTAVPDAQAAALSALQTNVARLAYAHYITAS